MEVSVDKVLAIQILLSQEEFNQLDSEINYVYSILAKDRKALERIKTLLTLKDKMVREVAG